MAVDALVERTAAVAELSAVLDDLRRGEGRLLFVSGEAGVGKTALCSAATALAADRGIVVRRGECDSVTTPAALGPLADAVPELTDALEEPPANRVRLFRRLRAVLTEVPTLLVLEDVHWSDEATLDLLRFLARRLGDVPLGIVATYRDEEVHGTHPLALLRGDLATTAAVRHLALEPLSRDGVAEVVRRAGSALDPVAVHASTAGNAFFVTELIAVGEHRLPGSVRDAVLARASRLSRPARDALAAAAVLGQRSRLDLVMAVAARAAGAAAVEDAVDECIERGLLRLESGDLAFRHELARLAVEESTPSAFRRRLHASALATGRESGVLDDRRLAHHADAGGDAAGVLEHAPPAARRAARLGAHREAVQLYRLALAHTTAADAGQAQLYEDLAYECYLVDRVGDARAARLAALEIRERLGDRAAVGVDQRWLSRLSWFLGRGEESERYGVAAVATLEPLGPSAELAMAYSNLSQLRMLAYDAEGAVRWGERAIRLAREVGARDVEIHALNNVGTAVADAGGRPEGRTNLVRSLDLALAVDAHEHVARAYTNLGSTGVASCRYADADADLRAGIAYCRERDLDSWSLYMTGWLAVSRLAQGHVAEADRLAGEVLERSGASPVARICALVTRAEIAIRQGEDATDMLAAVDDLARGTGELQRRAPVAGAKALAAWVAGRPDDVVRAVDEVWDLAVAHPRPWILGELSWWRHVAGARHETAAPIARPYRLMIDGALAAAAEEWAAVGAPLWEAICRALDDDPALALRGLQLADAVDAPAVRQALLRERHARGMSVPRGPRAATRANAYGLTGRELDVLSLVGEGLTNAEVAERLFLSEKTVAHHVSAALRKTGEPTRARAAAAVRRAGHDEAADRRAGET